MRSFSKSKLLSLRQCPKRLWLELHRPDLRDDSLATQRSFQIGHQVGDVAQRLYDPQGEGAVIDFKREGFSQAFSRTKELLATAQPIFEAGFSAGGALAFADVLLPVGIEGELGWRMVEVKSSTDVKDYYRDDAAVQAFVAKASGVRLKSIALAHIDNSWVYPGEGDYRGLLRENDFTVEAFSRSQEVMSWIAQAYEIDALPNEPAVSIGSQCNSPYACGFIGHCSKDLVVTECPVQWLPYIGNKAQSLAQLGIVDLRDVPDDVLNERQLRVKTHTLAKTVFFDSLGAKESLSACGFPAYFLDFESVQFAIPIWKGTRPYQQNVFQFSLHLLQGSGDLSHTEFLDLSGGDPAVPFAKALINACGLTGPVFVYNAAFEMTRIKELAERCPSLAEDLLAINARVVDLLPIARNFYYHPSQEGSWSIKQVLPAVVPELSYDALDGVRNGDMAMEVFQEAIQPETTLLRRAEIEKQLLAYCRLDTYAMVRLWQVFAGRTDMTLSDLE